MSKDHRLDIYVDAVTYMALRARSADEDRTVSQHVRNLIRRDLEQALLELERQGNGRGGGAEGEDA